MLQLVHERGDMLAASIGNAAAARELDLVTVLPHNDVLRLAGLDFRHEALGLDLDEADAVLEEQFPAAPHGFGWCDAVESNVKKSKVHAR